jgi:hypothetical protein
MNFNVDFVNEVFNHDDINKFRNESLTTKDLWAGTVHEGYNSFPQTARGKYGELAVKRTMEKLGHYVDKPSNTGHDFVIDGIKTEVKFSLCHKAKGKLRPSTYKLTHLSSSKDWERCVFMGVNYDCNIIVKFFTKEQFEVACEYGYMSRHQSGAKGGNDDWSIGAKRARDFLNSDLTYNLDEWNTVDRLDGFRKTYSLSDLYE